MKRMIRALFVAAIVIASLAYLYLQPTAEQRAILASVAAQVERSGVDDLAGTLRSHEPAVIYITAHGDAEILACTFPNAVGSSVAAFRDQFARWYVSRGPVVGPNGSAYMVYLAR